MEIMRTDYFTKDVWGWKPNCQLDLVLMIDTDTGGVFPLYSSASHDLPNEQLGPQLRLEKSSSGDLPWFWAWTVRRMQRQ